MLVTGAGGRIGAAICRAFGAAGAAVACCDLDPARAARTAEAIHAAGGLAAAIPGDVADEGRVEAVVAETTGRLGPIDVLVNCAGIFPNTPVVEMETAEWDRVFAVNVRGPMMLSRAVARQMLARGASGSIINVTSPAGSSARTGGAHYCGSKAALNLLTQTMAIELGPRKIRVNAVSPGLVLDNVVSTERPPAEEYARAVLQGIPAGRTGYPEEIAQGVLYLADDERASYVIGAILDVTGGANVGRPHLPPSRRRGRGA